MKKKHTGEDVSISRLENREQLARDVLEHMNRAGGAEETIREVLQILKQSTGFDAVGIRLNKCNDFPYYVQDGFSSDFLATENTLTSRMPDGGVCRDNDGNISLECTCGLVLSGRADLLAPFCTPGGSFWTNDSLQLLDLSAEQDPRFHPRNRCIHEGFHSVALIPLRAAGEIAGLLQFNDRRKDQFTLTMIQFFEGLAASIGIVISRRQAEESLRRSEARYRTILQTAMDGIWIVNKERRLVEVNETYCRMSGYGREELLAMRVADLEALETDSDVAARGQKITSEGEARFESRHRRKDGSVFDVEASIQYRPDDGGNFVVFLRDITERKEGEKRERLQLERMMQSQRLASLGTLMAGMAHEINNPNMFTMLNAPILKDIWGETLAAFEARMGAGQDFRIGNQSLSEVKETVDQLFGSIIKGSERIKSIVNELKDYARQEPDHMDDLVDINKVSRSAVVLAWNRIKGATDFFAADYEEGVPVFGGNSQCIQQAIINLLTNACDAVPDKGRTIRLRTRHDVIAKAVVLQISDEGVGMTPEVLARIRDPFFTTKRDGGGTGFGVSVAAKVVEEHGGTMVYESEPGKGTVVTVRVPVGG